MATDDRDPQLVVADGRGPNPPAVIFERAAAHAGSVEPGADPLALLADTVLGLAAAVSAGGSEMPDARLTPVAEPACQFLAGECGLAVVPVAGIPGFETKRLCGFCCPFRRERYYGGQSRIWGFFTEPAEDRITARELPSQNSARTRRSAAKPNPTLRQDGRTKKGFGG